MTTLTLQRELTARQFAVLKAAAAGLTVTETAEQIGLTYETVKTHRRLCQRGLPHVQIGRNLRFKLSRVDEWVEAQSGTSQSGEIVSLDSRRTA